MEFAMILDGIIAALLIATISYAFILNKKLNYLRAGETAMREAIDRFSESAEKAETNLARVKEIAAAGRDGPSTAQGEILLEPLVAEARRLAADLNLLIERGESVVARRRPDAMRPKNARRGRAATVGLADGRPTWAPGEEHDLADALKGVR